MRVPLPQHPDEHRPEGPVLLAGDRDYPRPLDPPLRRMFARWRLTVDGEIARCRAISFAAYPLATRLNTSLSLRVK